MSSPAILCIEGGGSKGRVLLKCGDRIFAKTDRCGLNPVDIGYETFEARIRSLILSVLTHLDCGPASVRVYGAFAGVGKRPVRRMCRDIIRRVLGDAGVRAHVRVVTDAEALIECYLSEKDGVAVIAGTGSICLGVKHRDRGSTITRVGGWGSYFDDGSGYRIGLRVIEKALRALDGREPVVPTVDLLCKRYGIRLGDIPRLFLPARREQIAALAQVAIEAYGRHDTYAVSVVKEAVGQLADMVMVVWKRARLGQSAEIVVSGGLFRSPVVMRLFKRRIKRVSPKATPQRVESLLPGILRLAQNPRRRGVA